MAGVVRSTVPAIWQVASPVTLLPWTKEKERQPSLVWQRVAHSREELFPGTNRFRGKNDGFIDYCRWDQRNVLPSPALELCFNTDEHISLATLPIIAGPRMVIPNPIIRLPKG